MNSRDSVRFELWVGHQHVDIFPSLNEAKQVAKAHTVANPDVKIIALSGPLPCAQWQYDRRGVTWTGPAPYGASEHAMRSVKSAERTED